MGSKKFFLHAVVLITLVVYSEICGANPQGAVNILTRYMYLKSPSISSLVKNKCGVEISYDEYYGSTECLKRISTAGDFYYYDIVIFPGNIYELVKKKIEIKNSDLNKVVKGYSSDVRNHYLAQNYPHNVVYFVLSLPGFIWNSKVIDLVESDKISMMFAKAKNNTVVLINGPAEIWNIIDNNRKLPHDSLAQVFAAIIKDANVYITDGYNKLYDKEDFAFAFQRSGDAVFIMKTARNKELSFLAHPDYSSVAPDLMAELNTRPETQCVARVLASKDALDIVQKETYYLSPYGTGASNNDAIFYSVYKKIFDRSSKVRWLDSFFAKNAKGYLELRGMWDKIHLLPQIVRNQSLVSRTSAAGSK